MTWLVLEYTCKKCGDVVCNATIITKAKGKAYRPPTRCLYCDEEADWRIQRIEIERVDDKNRRK
jgi:hypothetical protein